MLLIGGGARSRAYRHVVADLLQRPVTVPDADELVARGAAVQAAAVLRGTTVDQVAAGWPLGGVIVDPDPSVDAAAVRSTFAAALAAS